MPILVERRNAVNVNPSNMTARGIGKDIMRGPILLCCRGALTRRDSVVVSTSACHAAGRGSIPGPGALLDVNTWLCFRDCAVLCLSDATLKTVGPFYLMYMPWEVKYPTILHWKCVTCRGLHIPT